LRAHLAEFGLVAAQGLRNVGELIAIVRDDDDTRVPDMARQVTWHKTNPVSQRLASIPGIGPIIATALATTVADPNVFRSGREFAAWLGLVPRQNSTGGKTRLGGITKRGNRYLRRLLINGASANLLRSKATKADPWVIGLRRRRPPLVVAVALANKTARIAWAVMLREKEYQPRAVAA
jgi:transposase